MQTSQCLERREGLEAFKTSELNLKEIRLLE